MIIKWTEDAVADLDAMLAYIAMQDPHAAALIAERVLKAEEYIREFPRAASFDAETSTYDRYIPKTRIILTYELTEDTIWIIRAWHTSRNPETKPERTR